MKKSFQLLICCLCLSPTLCAQEKRLWVLSARGEMVEYDPATFAAKGTVKIPPEAMQAPQNIAVNHSGQILFTPPVSLPLAAGDLEAAHKVWFWNGHVASTIEQGVQREVAETGSNQAVTESAPVAFLSANGEHLFWIANKARRLQREEMDLSTATTWEAWQTDLSGAGRQDVLTVKLPDCRCPTGSCEESCPYGVAWMPESGASDFFLMSQVVAAKSEVESKVSTAYREEGGKWSAHPMGEPLQRVLDAASGGEIIVDAVPDTACCGWVNASNDQTLFRTPTKTVTLFDEQATYKNPDYDVSFYTSNARLSPELGYVAMTITATAKVNQPIQISENGQANPEESRQIRKALADLPAVEVKKMEETPRRTAFLPHASLVGWLNEREILIVEDHLLVAYNLASGARRKSAVRVEDSGRVFLR